MTNDISSVPRKTFSRRMSDVRSVKKMAPSKRSVPSNPEISSLSSGGRGASNGSNAISPARFLDSEKTHLEEIKKVSKESGTREKKRSAVKSVSKLFFWERWKKWIVSRWFSFASSLSFLSNVFGNRRLVWSSIFGIFLVALAWCSVGIFEKGTMLKDELLSVGTTGYGELSRAIDTAKERDFAASEQNFQKAFVSFSAASSLFDSWNGNMIEAARFLPVLSQLSSGKYLVLAARDISAAGESMSKVGGSVFSLGNPLSGENNVSFLEVFRNARGNMKNAERLLSSASENLDKVSIADIPKDKRDQFVQLKSKLPEALSGMRLFLAHGDIFSDILGGNGPRKFLFLFQNNQEMRATGGFIGSYAFLDVNDGRVRKFFVDGIFNPDGQLRSDIVPPEPIQKISAGWSLHDSNWFPDFPVSAEKAISFYEKTGGPTVDGVIAFTPEILKKFLSITGPIAMDTYGVTVDENNFLETIQYQVEVAYDKKENKPKQILSDLAPILLDRIFGEAALPGTFGKALAAIESGFSEKHLLFYSRSGAMEKLISNVGWSGEVLSSDRDYVSVINSNINGYKTDGVIDETISHRAEIRDDGSVVDTITVRRVHTGGNTGREWWDKVNADYMRVSVPLGSTLLSASGYTRETVMPPLDYVALHFSRDEDVERERMGTRIDPESGTRISDDAGKTVFGNWVYVSPGETVEVTYTYLLPFHVDPKETQNSLDSYSIIFQKQAGSKGSKLISEVIFPKRFRSVWQSEGNLVPFERGFHMETDLKYDRFLGVLFSSTSS